jgi:hypothetical protein
MFIQDFLKDLMMDLKKIFLLFLQQQGFKFNFFSEATESTGKFLKKGYQVFSDAYM